MTHMAEQIMKATRTGIAVCVLAATSWLGSAAWAQQPAPADPPDAFAELEALVEAAPARQIGQPGNEKVGELIAGQFAAAAARENEGKLDADVRAAADAADQALADWLEATDDAQVVGGARENAVRSPAYVHYTAEAPAGFTIAFLVIAAALVLGWWYQRRAALMSVALICLGVGIALPIIDAAVTTPVERINRAQWLRQVIDEATTTLPTLRARLARQTDRIAELETQLETGPEDKQQTITNLENLVAKLRAETSGTAELREAEGRLEAARRTLSRWRRQTKGEIEHLRQSVQEAKAEIERLEQNLGDWREVEAEWAETLATRITEAESLVEAADVEADIDRLERALAELRAEQQALRGQAATTMEGVERAKEQGLRSALINAHRAGGELARRWQSGRITYPAPAFIPARTTMTGPAGDPVRLYQMLPNLVEPANLPDQRFEGRLVYVGQATTEELSGRDLRGAAAVVEFNCSDRWIDTVQLGAEVVIVLEPPAGRSMNQSEAAVKFNLAPLSIPRFFVKRSEIAGLLGRDPGQLADETPAVEIEQDGAGRWQRRTVSSEWLFIPGTAEPASANVSFVEDPSRQIVHIQAYKDAMSIVPELSPGATSAANVVLLQRLVRHFEANPPTRPVLLTAVNDHTNALNGEQEVAYALFADTTAIQKELTALSESLAESEYVSKLYSAEPSHDLIERLRYDTVTVARKAFNLNDPAKDKLHHERNMLRELEARIEREREVYVEAEQLTEQQLKTDEHYQELTREIERLESEGELRVRLVMLFKRIGGKLYFDDLDAREKEALAALFREIELEAAEAAKLAKAKRDQMVENLSLRRRLMRVIDPHAEPDNVAKDGYDAMFAALHAPLSTVANFTLDLTFGSGEAGFFHVGYLRKESNFQESAARRVSRLVRLTLKTADELATETETPSPFADTLRNKRGISWQGHLGGYAAIAARVPHQFSKAGLTLTGVRDARSLTFTPDDTADRINRENYDRLMRFAEQYLPRLVDADALGATVLPERGAQSLVIHLTTRKQDKFSVNPADAPVLPGAMIVAAQGKAGLVAMPGDVTMLGQVRPWAFLMADRDGEVRLRGQLWKETSLQAFDFDDSFSMVTGALDFGEGEKAFSSSISFRENESYVVRSLLVFDAMKTDLIGLTEPLTLLPVPQIDLLDAVQNSLPRHYSLSGIQSTTGGKYIPSSGNGTGSAFMEPARRFKLRIGNGLAINMAPDKPESDGEGFDTETSMLRNLVLTSAKDLYLLTDKRLNLMTDKGVIDETAVEFNRKSEQELGELDVADDQAQSEQMLVGAEKARGLAYRAYDRALSTLNDLIKAVVIFLALVIPFCFFLMKLITPFTDINKQLGLFAGIFVIMAITLRLVHPAFEVATTPQVVILAFVILGLAGFVTSVIIQRFNSSMNTAVEETLQSDSMDASQGRLAGVAFLVGVNNMKRRRIRTTLTTVTIVLVTFTMLSVISVGQDVEPVRVRVSSETPYNGFLFTSSGLAPIDSTRLNRLRAHFEDEATTVARIWTQRQDKYGTYLPYEVEPVHPVADARAATVSTKVLLGLEKTEDGFLAPMPVVAGRWFTGNEANEIVLSVEAAKLIGITPENFEGRELRVNGRRLALAGLVDDRDFANLSDLAEVPLVPMLVAASQEQAGETEAAREAADVSGDVTDIPGAYEARPNEIAIVPYGVAQSIGSSDARTLSVKFDQEDAAAGAARTWAAANALIEFQNMRLNVSVTEQVPLGDGERVIDPAQYAMASSSSAEVGGVLKVSIAIFLAATIILNTMLGSVMERKREISIYNAIGLNPTHVMVFFLAESLVFGLVGAVAGYLIGQILSVVITRLDIIDLNLNYSSLSVMVVIFMSIATVLVSTIYPAMMAARAAVPSGQRRWSAPQPDGDALHVQFPFSYDATRVVAVCAYLREYMRQNSEASTGKFIARLGPVGMVPAAPPDDADPDAPEGHDRAYVMLFEVACAPYDLGVNQHMEVYAYYDHHVKAHMLAVHLSRISGEKSNWVSVNQPFLEALRKRLLGWRSQKPETQQYYYEIGEKLFANAPMMAEANHAEVHA